MIHTFSTSCARIERCWHISNFSVAPGIFVYLFYISYFLRFVIIACMTNRLWHLVTIPPSLNGRIQFHRVSFPLVLSLLSQDEARDLSQLCNTSDSMISGSYLVSVCLPIFRCIWVLAPVFCAANCMVRRESLLSMTAGVCLMMKLQK
jgi:hypothetical protein